MLWGAEIALSMVAAYRIVHIDGRMGGGKTSLAFRLAYELLGGRYGYRYLLSNCPSVWCDKVSDVVLRQNEAGDAQYLDAIVLLDEGGQFIQSSRDAQDYTAYLRKMNVLLLIPSYEPPPRRLKTLRIAREFNLMRFGLPVWVYRYFLSDGPDREVGRFYWYDPGEIYGVFDSVTAPATSGGLAEMLADLKAELSARWEMLEDGQQYKPGQRTWLGAVTAERAKRSIEASRGVVGLETLEQAGTSVVFERAAGELAAAVENWQAVRRPGRG